MKMTAVFLLAACIQVHARVHAQKVTLDVQNASLENVLKLFRKQTDHSFVYDLNAVRKAPRVSLSVKEMPLEEALRACLHELPFTYTRVNNTYVLKWAPRKNMSPEEEATPPLSVSGTITDENGTPLTGVTVVVKGQKKATQTNELGAFTLNQVEENSVLVVSYVGYQSQEIPVQGRASINVSLKPAQNALDETVIIGYGKTSRRLNTGSVSSVSSEIISNQPVSDPLAALQGRVPGLMISANNGAPGSSFQVRVRGEHSMKQGNDPLYIIDGVPFVSTPINQFNGSNGQQSPLNSINPNDIERIDVLKDADATAIYGSRGANGVVLITTKKGKAGESQVNFNIYTGVSQVSRKLEMLNTEQYLAMREEAFKNDGVTPTESLAPDLLTWDRNHYTDWQDLLIGNTANITEAQASFSGGSKQTRFFLSSTFRKETTTLLGDKGYRKGGVLMNIDHGSSNGKFKLNASLNYTSDKNESIPTDVTQYITRSPNYQAYDEDGGLYWLGTESNPMAYLYQDYESKTNSLIGNASLSYTILPGLIAKTSLGYTQLGMNQVYTLPFISFNPNSNVASQAQYGTSSVNSYIAEPQLDYTRSFGNSKLNVLAGASWQHSLSDGYYFLGTGFSSDAQLRNMGAASSLTRRNNTNTLYHYQSVFGRVNYAVDQKYILNASFRRDGSSRFGPGKRFGNFGSLGAAWIFSQESFMDNVGFLSFGKFRTSYGTTGNDQIGDYQYLDSWSTTTFAYGGVVGLSPSRVFNPIYSWEENRKFEAAVELGFFTDKLLLGVNYYNNISDNQLIGQTLSSQSGFNSYVANMPATVENSGWEISITSNNINKKDFSWTTAFNLTVPRNILLDYPGIESSPDANAYEVGQSIRIIKGFNFTGVNPETGIAEFEDVNRDGVLTEAGDWVVMGNTMPVYYGGLTNDLRYKNFQLSIFLQFVDQEAPGILYGPMASPYGARANKDVTALDRWQQPGDITNIPRATTTTSNVAYTTFNNQYRYSTATWSDAAYLRLKNVSLKYDLSSITQKWKVPSCQLYFQGQNLLTFTNYHGLDPETQGFNRSFVSQVNPFGSVKPVALPVMRSYTLGLRFQL